MGLPLSL